MTNTTFSAIAGTWAVALFVGLIAMAISIAPPRPAAAPVPQTEVTNPAILRNLERQVERGGYGCPSLVGANTLGDDEYGRPEFLVACMTATRGLFYRVVFPPTGPAIVRPDKLWR